MPRMARLVVPGFPHHVTQRGIRKQRTFFDESDYSDYLNLLRKASNSLKVDIWAYCLMPNHVHVIAVPQHECSLGKLFGSVHGKYARTLNERYGWQGHLWQQRFFSVVMDDEHAKAALRYVEMNPVRARLCETPDEWPWSSVHAHLGNAEDDLVNVKAMQSIVSDWTDFIQAEAPTDRQESIRRHTRTGRPAGDADFVDMLEVITGKTIHPLRPGPTKK